MTCWIFLSVMMVSLSQRGNQVLERCARFYERRGLACFADRQSFSIDELHVRDAEEGQEVANVRGLRVARRAFVNSAACREHIGLLAGEQSDRALLRVLEGDPGARDMVEVRL